MRGASLHIGILGSLSIEFDGLPIELRSVTHRRAIVFLALHANEVVSTDRLADAVWGKHAPADFQHAVHSLVYRVRCLSPKGNESVPLVRHDPGYLLEIPLQQIDSHVFTLQADRGRTLLGDQPAEAREYLAAALTLWRGEPLLDVAYERWAAAEIRRLNEVRLMVCENLAAANIAVGDAELAISELEMMTELHPLRESLWVLLWQALTQTGRHLEVVASHRRATEVLTHEFSITPSAHFDETAQALASGQ
jgi:DNA-binding SARP family transcriptional activator